MFNALSIGATGMQSQQLNVDTIANNLVNVNTAGFKRAHVTFTDLMTTEASRIGGSNLTGRPGSFLLGPEGGPLSAVQGAAIGVGLSSVTKSFDSGPLNQTGSPWDVAIQGDGFLSVGLADGSQAYTRGGALKVSSDGQLVTQSGMPMNPSIHIPSDATSLLIAKDGTVTVTVPNQRGPIRIGQLQMMRFANPGSLVALGDGLYQANEASGEPIAGNPGSDGFGVVHQGFLEGSNVKMVDEMVDLMVAQRTYQASVKVVQTADELLGMINNLHK